MPARQARSAQILNYDFWRIFSLRLNLDIIGTMIASRCEVGERERACAFISALQCATIAFLTIFHNARWVILSF